MKTELIFDRLTPIALWVFFFLYLIIVGLIVSNFLIPNLSFYESFILTSDSYYFDKYAINLADDIKEHGWKNWKIFLKPGVSGQSSFLAILYYFFGKQAWLVILFNAIFCASSGVIFYFIAKEILGKNILSKQGATLFACLFIIFPSTLISIIHVNKESCLSLGVLFGLWTIIKILSIKNITHGVVGILCAMFFSLFCIAVMKPYMLQFFLVILLFIIFLQCIKFFPWTFLNFGLLLFFFLNTFFLFTFISSSSDLDWISGETYISASSDPNFLVSDNFLWKRNVFIPEIIDRKISAVAYARASLIGSGLASNANSMIDVNEIPSNAIEIFKYAPRALHISLLAPFPNKWFNGGMLNFLSSMEMLACYLAYIGLFFFLIFRNFNYKIILILLYVLIPLVIFGTLSPNIGTLYRVRYIFLMVIVMLGVCGWFELVEKIKAFKKTL